jgi:hypothetical protein
VSHFLVFRDLPGVTRDQYLAAQQAIRDASMTAARSGAVVTYLGGYFLPGRGRAVCVFEAESATAISLVNTRAGVPATEVLEAIHSRPRE